MRKISRLGLLLIAATTAGCLYPSLKMGAGTGGTPAAGGTTAADGGVAGAGGGAAGAGGGVAGAGGGGGGSGRGGDAGVVDASGGQPDVPMGGAGGVFVTGGTGPTGGTSTGGISATAGAGPTGGTSRTGGTTFTGGISGAGGILVTGGTTSPGGTTSSGGRTSSGGTTTSSGGTTNSGGTTSPGGTTSRGGTTSSGGTTSTGGTTTSGGATAAGGGSGGVTSTGGTSSTGGAGTGGAATGGSTSTQPANKVFSQCRFHFGTIDSIAKTFAPMISQLDFFTPGWMMGTFNQGAVCTESASGAALAGLVPVDVTYVAANYAKAHHQLCDCNVSGCSGGTLCQYGSQYITQEWANILAAYTSNSTGFAACLGGRPIIFEMEPDWFQYVNPSQSEAWSLATAGTNMTALVNALKSSLPNAVFSLDISPWIPENGSGWYSNFNMSLFTFINTSGGGTNANNAQIRSNNAMTWAGVHQVTGKPILADTGYGAATSPAGEDPLWNDPANINARIADGVVSISQYTPTSAWGGTIANIRSQLNAPTVCP